MKSNLYLELKDRVENMNINESTLRLLNIEAPPLPEGVIPISERKHTGEDNLPDCFIHPKDSIPHGPYCYFGR